jgi:uncharacterized membrane protein (DUF2068 family)
MGLKKHHLRYKDQTPRERTWTIHLIAAEKFIKGTILVVIAVKLLSLMGQDVHAYAEDFVTRHGIDVGNRYIQEALSKLVGMEDRRLIQFSSGAFVYAAVLFVEGTGLWLQKRWAEFLTAIGSGLLLPVEIYELYEKFTWVRIVILAVNIFIVWYLVTRLKDEAVEPTENALPS